MPEPQWRRIEPQPTTKEQPIKSEHTTAWYFLGNGLNIVYYAPYDMPTARPVCVEGEWRWQAEEETK
jgi:hypothetical protein